jgi:hypothetical protein
VDNTHLDRAIDAVYDAALGDTSWDDAVRGLVRAHGAVLLTPMVTEAEGGLWALHDVPQEIQRRYVYEYTTRNVWLERGIAAGQAILGETSALA